VPDALSLDPFLLSGLSRLGEVLGTTFMVLLAAVLFKRYVLVRFEAMAAATDNDVDDRLVYFLRRFYNGIVLFSLMLVLFRLLGIELTPLLASAGIVGIAIAYAAKDILGNFLSGIFLLLDRPLKMGDRIKIESIGTTWGSWGDVIDVGLRSTTIKNTDGVYVTYPNARLADSIIKNFTPAASTSTRFRIRVAVDPDADLRRALEVLLQVAREEPRVEPEPAPSAVLRSLYDDAHGAVAAGAVLELRCHVADIRIRARLRSDMLLAIREALHAAGISLARLQVELETPDRLRRAPTD
jgi:small-conductance mechanosensitive channel